MPDPEDRDEIDDSYGLGEDPDDFAAALTNAAKELGAEDGDIRSLIDDDADAGDNAEDIFYAADPIERPEDQISEKEYRQGKRVGAPRSDNEAATPTAEADPQAPLTSPASQPTISETPEGAETSASTTTEGEGQETAETGSSFDFGGFGFAPETAQALSGLPQGEAEHINNRLSYSSDLYATFDRHRDTLKAAGVANHVDAARQLLSLHEWALKEPMQYVGWFARQSGKGFEDIARGLGYEVKKIDPNANDAPDDDDDEFLSDAQRERIQRERAELRELRAKSAPAAIDIDTIKPPAPSAPSVAEMRQTQEAAKIKAELERKDDNGEQVYKHADMLLPYISQLAKAEQDADPNKVLGVTDLARLYGEAELVHPQTRGEAIARLKAQEVAAETEEQQRRSKQQVARSRKAQRDGPVTPSSAQTAAPKRSGIDDDGFGDLEEGIRAMVH